jgi:hypothetical protein
MQTNTQDSSNDGVLVTIRDPPQFQSARDPDREIEHSLSVSPERKLYHQRRGPRERRRLKGCMKQVVGGAFSGYLNESLEQETVDALVEESKAYRTDPRKSLEYNERVLRAITDRILAKVRKLLESRVRFCLGTIVNKLFDESVTLRWDKKTNNCQKFCESIIDYEVFSSLVSTRDQDAGVAIPRDISPLYLMSFVCRPGGYAPENVSTRFDVPNGLTEEYILKFRFGQHDEADIFDTLQEFWHDWGAFGGSLYENQKLFPWDCTEAYSRHPAYCNDCSLSKHIWSFPFDSWSIIQLHLHKDRHLYPPSGEIAGERLLTDEEWMQNRLTVLLAQHKLIQGAKGMAQTQEFRQRTAWLHKQSEARIDRLKLGGIHRAQPYSHQYERGAYQEYFVAEWAHLQRPKQIEAYERMRNERVAMPDMPHPVTKTQKSKSSRSGGSDPDALLVAWYGFDFGAGDTCPYATDGWDGSYPTDDYCVNVPDASSSTGNCGSGGGGCGGGPSCGSGGGCGGGCGG